MSVFALHVEETLFPGARERYQLARLRNPDGAHAQVLLADDVRRRRALMALERVLVAYAIPPAERAALCAAPSGEGFRALLTLCARPQLPLCVYNLIHPGALSIDVDEMARVYAELERALSTEPATGPPAS